MYLKKYLTNNYYVISILLVLLFLIIPLPCIIVFTLYVFLKKDYFDKNSIYMFFVISFILSGLLVLSSPYNSDTENYLYLYNTILSGISNYNIDGIEIGYIIFNKIISKFSFSFDFFLIISQVLINLSLLFYLLKRNCNIGLVFILIFFCISPFYLINTSLLIRNFISISIVFLFVNESKSKLYNIVIIFVSSLIHFFCVLFIPCVFKKFRIFLYKKTIIFITFFLYIVQSNHFEIITLNKEILDSLSSNISVLSRKILFLYEIREISSLFIIKNSLIILLSSLFLINAESSRYRIVISAFQFSSIIVLLFPYGNIVITRIGLLSYFLYPIYVIIYTDSFKNTSKSCYIISLLLIVFSIMNIIYSFIYNDFLNDTFRVLALKDFLLINFFKISYLN